MSKDSRFLPVHAFTPGEAKAKVLFPHEVFNVPFEYISFFQKLYPTLRKVESLDEATVLGVPFILQQDLNHPRQMVILEDFGSIHYVVFSKILFHNKLEPIDIADLVLAYRSVYFKERKIKWMPGVEKPDYSIDNLSSYLDTGEYRGLSESDPLFSDMCSCIGAYSFVSRYLDLSKVRSQSSLQASVLTMLYKVFNEDTVYWKKMRNKLGQKVVSNWHDAVQVYKRFSYNNRELTALEFIAFYLTLFK